MQYGKIHDANSAFFSLGAGSATVNGKSYTLSVGAGRTEPIITSAQTGKSFTLGWEDMLQMAINAGIDVPDQKETT